VVLSDFSTICGADELTTTSVSSLDSVLTPPEIIGNAVGSDRGVVAEPELCHVWSLGMVGCCITTGVSASSVAELHQEILNPLMETYPVTLIQLLKSCINVDPLMRPSLARVRSTLQGLQDGHLPANGTECHQTGIAPEEIECQLETTTSEALPQSPPEQANEGEANGLDSDATRQATTPADSFGLMTFPVTDSRNNRITGNGEMHTLNNKTQDPPPSYAEVCGNPETRPLDSASSSDDELTPGLSARPAQAAEPRQLQRHSHPRLRPRSAIIVRDSPDFDEADSEHEYHPENNEERIPLRITDSDDYIPMPLFSDSGMNDLVHVDYRAVDVDRFCSATSASRSVAQHYLELSGGVLRDAITHYMETSGRQPQSSTRPQRSSTGESRTILGRPRLRTEVNQDNNTSSHNVHQLARRPVRTEHSHRQSWAGSTYPITPLRGPEPARRRISEGGICRQDPIPRGWFCPHSREPRDCRICAMFLSGRIQSRSRPRSSSHQGSNPQRKQSSNCKLS
jgi:hypothetical protein